MPMFKADKFRMRNPGGGVGEGWALRSGEMSGASLTVCYMHQPRSCIGEGAGVARRRGRGSMSKLAKIAVITSLLVAATAHAEMPQRVLIVDTVSFSPALEKANARQKMMDAVNATVAQHAWQPVPSADCHNLTCVGPASAAATANYALMLTGSFAHGGDAMYATEVGVSLWHDGGFVARWTEEDEQAEAAKTPAGVFFACGPPSGTCVAPLMTSKMQQYSARLLEAESAAVQKRVAAAAITAVKPSVAAAPAISGTTPAPPATPESGGGRIVGWSLVGVGVAV